MDILKVLKKVKYMGYSDEYYIASPPSEFLFLLEKYPGVQSNGGYKFVQRLFELVKKGDSRVGFYYFRTYKNKELEKTLRKMTQKRASK